LRTAKKGAGNIQFLISYTKLKLLKNALAENYFGKLMFLPYLPLA
jgi:hypothetical protein